MGIGRLAQYAKRMQDGYYPGRGSKLPTPILAKIEGVTLLGYKGSTCLYLVFPPEHPLARAGGIVFVHQLLDSNAKFTLLFCFVPTTADGHRSVHITGMEPPEVYQLIPRAVIRFCWEHIDAIHKSRS